MADSKIPFAVQDGRMVDVRSVSSGRACNCKCPNCGAPLIAKKGEIRVHHFAHDPIAKLVECTGAVETAIHKMAKQMVIEHRRLTVPKLDILIERSDNKGTLYRKAEELCPTKEIYFEEVAQEVGVDSFRADLMGTTARGCIYIEIKVTHKVDKFKKLSLRELDCSVLEIDLSGINRLPATQEVFEAVVESVDNKRWISFRGYAKKKSALKSLVDEQVSLANRQQRQIIKKHPPQRIKWQVKQRKELVEAQPPVIPARSHEVRRFYCERCREVTSILNVDVPAEAKTVNCKLCGAVVSTTRV